MNDNTPKGPTDNNQPGPQPGTDRGEPDPQAQSESGGEQEQEKQTEQKGSDSPEYRKLEGQIESLRRELEEERSKTEQARNESIEERKNRQKAMETEGQWKELIAEKDQELTKLESQVTTLKDENKHLQAKVKTYLDRDEQERKDMLSKFTPAQQERFADPDKWSLSEIRYLYEQLHGQAAEAKPLTKDNDRQGSKNPQGQPATLGDAIRQKLNLP